MKAPEFTDEQRAYLYHILSIAPCHITGTHHLLDPLHICSHQKSEAWEKAMVELGFNRDEPGRVLHNDECYWCHKSRNACRHEAWSLGVLQPLSYFTPSNPSPHREVWWLAEHKNIVAAGNTIELANLKQFLIANKYPAPKDCPGEECSRVNKGWCPNNRCIIAVEDV